jgi:hypothetical protein
VKINKTDFACGAVFILFGLFWGSVASRMQLGSAVRMGPGYFPLVVSICIVAVGLLILGKAVLASDGPSPPLHFAWRAMILLTFAPIMFSLLIRQVGFVSAVAVIVGLSFFASRRAKLMPALLVTVAITLLCVAIFKLGLDLPTPLFTWN